MKKRQRERAIFAVTVVFMSIYLIWRAFFTLPIGQPWFVLLLGIVLLAAETESALGTFELFWRRSMVKDVELPHIPEDLYPHVDIFVATHNESVDLLYKTVNACTFMEYPDKRKVHIYLCDDGNRPEMAQLAQDLGVTWLGLAGNRHAKSGNFNNALSKSDSPIVVTFDADMIPRRNFLMRSVPYHMLPYMKKNEAGEWVKRKPEEIDPDYRIGFVQTPQSFYNPDLFQYNLFSERNVPNEQSFFTHEINVMRNAVNASAYTGSNTLLSRQALMDIGGFPTDTITEDFETGILIQSKGYTTYATSEVLASGLSPTTIKSMFAQRIRWARGVIQSIKNTRLPVNRGLSMSARISYMMSFSYWWCFFRRFIFILAPVCFALFDMSIARVGFWDLILFWVPSHVFYSISMRLVSSDTRNQRWAQIIDTIMMPYLIIPVFLETIGVKQMKFKVTKKDKGTDVKDRAFHYAIPHLILLAMSVLSVIRFVGDKYGMALIYSSVILFWLVYNIINLAYAVLFMTSRPLYRSAERFPAEEKLTIAFGDHVITTRTADVSEGGLSFVMDYPAYFPGGEAIAFTIETPHYRVTLHGHILYIRQDVLKWRYAAAIQRPQGDDLRQYLQIIYDRKHGLPDKIDPWVTAADDFLINTTNRLAPSGYEKRVLPRVRLEIPHPDHQKLRLTLVDFNYRYALVCLKARNDPIDPLDFALTGALRLRLSAPMPMGARGGMREYLYMVENWEELAYNPEMHRFLNARVYELMIEDEQATAAREALQLKQAYGQAAQNMKHLGG